MRNTFIMVSSVVVATSAMAQLAAAQTTLPTAIQADRATVQQDVANLHNLFTQLKTDEQAGSAAVAADHTAVQLARMQARLDFAKLHEDAQGLLQTDQQTLMAALTQLHADQVANNAGAVTTDQTAVQNAQAQLKSDHKAVFGGLGGGFGMHQRHGQG